MNCIKPEVSGQLRRGLQLGSHKESQSSIQHSGVQFPAGPSKVSKDLNLDESITRYLNNTAHLQAVDFANVV